MYFPERIFPVSVSEGCYWGKCDFCDYPYLASRDPFRIRALFRDPVDVLADMTTVSESPLVKRVDLISDSIPMAWFGRLLAAGAGKLVAAAGLRLECSIRAEPTGTGSHFDAMVECGIDSVTIGVEALADEVLEGINKGNTWADIKRAVALAHARGIRVKANLIYDHPRIKSNHLSEMQDHLDELAPMLDSIGVHSFGLSPYAPIAFDLEKAGIMVSPDQKKERNDHGNHHLAFRRIVDDPQRDHAIDVFRRDVERLSFKLDVANGRALANQTVIPLPFRWTGTCAVRDSMNADLMVQIPGNSAPFYFFVGALNHA
jgi:hypothetical protein